MRKNLILLMLLTLTPSWGGLVPMLEPARLIEESTLIVIGKVASVEFGGEMVDEKTQTKGRLATGVIEVDRTIKGQEFKGKTVVVRYFYPASPIGYGSLRMNAYRLFFLTLKDGGYYFSDPHYPSIAATRIPFAETGSISDDIALSSSLVLDQASTLADKQEAVLVLGSLNSPRATAALREAVRVGDLSLKLDASAALLRQGDASTLGFAESMLSEGTVPRFQLLNLAYSIRGIDSEAAIPSLARILRSPLVEARRAAAQALRKTGSQKALPALSAALDDPDPDTRYFAVIGLAQITGDSEWGPLQSDFTANPARYTDHWKQWMTQNIVR